MTTARAGTHDRTRTITTPSHAREHEGRPRRHQRHHDQPHRQPDDTHHHNTTTQPTHTHHNHHTPEPQTPPHPHPPNQDPRPTPTQPNREQEGAVPARRRTPTPPNRPGTQAVARHPPQAAAQPNPSGHAQASTPTTRHPPRQQPPEPGHQPSNPATRHPGGSQQHPPRTPPAAPPPSPCANLSGLCGTLSNFSVARRPGSGACPNLRIGTRSTLSRAKTRPPDLRGH